MRCNGEAASWGAAQCLCLFQKDQTVTLLIVMVKTFVAKIKQGSDSSFHHVFAVIRSFFRHPSTFQSRLSLFLRVAVKGGAVRPLKAEGTRSSC